MSPKNSLDSLFRDTKQQLEDAGVDNPTLDARVLICNVLGIERAQMAAEGSRILTDEEIAGIRALVGRRCRRESIGRILGQREFWSLPFELNAATLEPRPDSETLVELVTKEFRNRPHLKILDAGAGSGCLLLAILHELPEVIGVGVDISPDAVDQARHNAENLGLQSRATFRISEWLDNIVDDLFDVIISNPPYIKSGDIPTLMPEVRNYDPIIALDGGADGLEAYRQLIPQLPKRLTPGGVAIFEVGQGQATAVGELFTRNGFDHVTFHMDLSGIERCVKAIVS